MTYPNGDVYEGDWKDDKRHGNGKYTFFANGDIHEVNGITISLFSKE